MKEQLEQKNKEIASVTAEAKAAYGAYESIADEAAEAKAAWELAKSTADAKEESELKGRYDTLKEKEVRRKKRYEDLKEEKERFLEDRRALEAKLPGPGKRTPLPACSTVSAAPGGAGVADLSMVRVRNQVMILLERQAAGCRRRLPRPERTDS